MRTHTWEGFFLQACVRRRAPPAADELRTEWVNLAARRDLNHRDETCSALRGSTNGRRSGMPTGGESSNSRESLWYAPISALMFTSMTAGLVQCMLPPQAFLERGRL